MNLKEIKKIVGSIQSHLFRNSNSFSVGMLKSHFRGAGLQFKEHQVYNPGDDVRFIDWKLSAKTNSTFIKTFEEERNVEIYIYLDISETMLMGFRSVSKLQAAIEITCLVYLLAEKSKDRVGVIIHTNENKVLPLCAGQEGIILLISQLEKLNILNEDGKVNLGVSCDYKSDGKKKMGLIKNLVARGKQVIVLTDLSRMVEIDLLNKLLYRANMHCFVIESPLDGATKLPFSVFGKRNNLSLFTKSHRVKKAGEIKGRFKKLRVDERYLEKFVREML